MRPGQGRPVSKPLTGPQMRALAALRELSDSRGPGFDPRPVWPRELARTLWPDSVGWTKRTRKYGTNDPGAVGGTMPMKAATLLWRLHERGLAWRPDWDSNGWEITERGRRVLAGIDEPLDAER